MLETIKDLFESDQLGPHLPARLPLPEKVHALIRRRFERLSPTASRVAQAAAVLQSDFDLDLIGAMLGATPMDLLEPWEELEAAQVLSGPRFSHDLVYESVRASLSAPVRAFMHRRAAEVLEAGGVRGARVARHWLAGQETARAAQHLLEAAARAVDGLRLHEAANFFDQAADALEAQGDLGAAFEARVSALRQRLEVDVGERTEAASKRLLALARTPRQRAQARLVQAMLLSTRGRFAQIEAVARSGLEDAVIAEDLQLEADLLEAAATVPMTLGRPEEAIPTIERMVEIYRALEHPLGLATATLGLGLARRRFDRLEALRHFREAHRLAARANLPNEQASALNNIARTSAEIGWVDQALEAYTRAGDLLRSTGGAVDTQLVSLTGLARARLLAGDYAGALEATREALTLGEGRQFAWLGMIHLVRAQILHGVGDAEGARRELGIALGWAGFPSYNRALLSLVRAELEPEFNLAAVLPEVEASRDGVLIGHYRLIEAQRLPPEAALESLRVALEVATDQHLGGMRAAVLARRAQVLLTLGQPDAAIKAALEALELNRTFTPPLEQPELRLTHHRVLAAMHAQNAPEPLEPLRAGMTWLSDTMHRVPPEFRQGFLERNPVNRTFLETARQFGLEVSVPD